MWFNRAEIKKMVEQAKLSVEMAQGPFSDFKQGESVFVSPNEMVTTRDFRTYLKTNQLVTGYPTDYHCAKVYIDDNGVKVDWTNCEEYKKRNALKPGLDAKQPQDSLPVVSIVNKSRFW